MPVGAGYQQGRYCKEMSPGEVWMRTADRPCFMVSDSIALGLDQNFEALQPFAFARGTLHPF